MVWLSLGLIKSRPLGEGIALLTYGFEKGRVGVTEVEKRNESSVHLTDSEVTSTSSLLIAVAVRISASLSFTVASSKSA